MQKIQQHLCPYIKGHFTICTQLLLYPHSTPPPTPPLTEVQVFITRGYRHVCWLIRVCVCLCEWVLLLLLQSAFSSEYKFMSTQLLWSYVCGYVRVLSWLSLIMLFASALTHSLTHPLVCRREWLLINNTNDNQEYPSKCYRAHTSPLRYICVCVYRFMAVVLFLARTTSPSVGCGMGRWSDAFWYLCKLSLA